MGLNFILVKLSRECLCMERSQSLWGYTKGQSKNLLQGRGICDNHVKSKTVHFRFQSKCYCGQTECTGKDSKMRMNEDVRMYLNQKAHDEGSGRRIITGAPFSGKCISRLKEEIKEIPLENEKEIMELIQEISKRVHITRRDSGPPSVTLKAIVERIKREDGIRDKRQMNAISELRSYLLGIACGGRASDEQKLSQFLNDVKYLKKQIGYEITPLMQRLSESDVYSACLDLGINTGVTRKKMEKFLKSLGMYDQKIGSVEEKMKRGSESYDCKRKTVGDEVMLGVELKGKRVGFENHVKKIDEQNFLGYWPHQLNEPVIIL